MHQHKAVSRRRHVAKAITWRVIATATTFLLAWAITGKVEVGAAIGGAEASVKMVLYYLHERAWYRFGYGVMEHTAQTERKVKA
ncbi:DUF2061 domain-containing protein [Candidatus Saccharibacteria bacterium]|nr:DUF2061 domain-containing protein [Candidatus Saccharibacteria bacterium]